MMKILVVSNFYPPHFIGGYELGCRDVVEGLRARGHEVRVLTSTYGVGTPCSEDGVERRLRLIQRTRTYPQYLRALFQREWIDQRALRRALQAYAPDLCYVWNPARTSMAMVCQAFRGGARLCCFVSDSWLADFSTETDPWFSFWRSAAQAGPKRVIKRLLQTAVEAAGMITTSASYEFGDAQFASLYLKTQAIAAGRPVGNGEVIHWGVDTERFAPSAAPVQRPVRLLYVGQILEHKGVHTAVEALGLLRENGRHQDVTLDIVGRCHDPEYEARLKTLIAERAMGDVIRFHGLIAREDLPGVYRDHDVLVFPSMWEEPFSITLLEGMASGLAVVSTVTGGTGEILEEGYNGVLFPKGDGRRCAERLTEVIEDAELRRKLGNHARLTVVRKYRFALMLDKIETALSRLADRRGTV